MVQTELFDEHEWVEVIDPDDPKSRQKLCGNPQGTQRERAPRQRLLDFTREGLNKIAKKPLAKIATSRPLPSAFA